MKKYAIATVTDSKYLLATQVLIYSFLKHHPKFEGDFVIIESDLTDEERASLGYFPNVRFERPSKVLLERITILSHYWQVAKENPKQFYSLEAFNLKGYEKLLFLDSDMLCVGNILQLFQENTHAPIQAVADSLKHKGQVRQQHDFLPCKMDAKIEGRQYYTSFNSGFLLLNYANLSAQTYFDLVKLINPIFFQTNRTRHTDQFVLNQYFHPQVQFLPDTYNYLLNVHPKMNITTIKAISDLKFIHYLEYTKPWKIEQADNSFGSLWQEYHTAYINDRNES